jgi:hypothetical protein
MFYTTRAEKDLEELRKDKKSKEDFKRGLQSDSFSC